MNTRSVGPTSPYQNDDLDRVGLAAVIVYFRTPEHLALCLDGLRGQISPPDEIVVIDNSSTEDAVDERPAPGQDWKWVRAERNLGFGAACNVGAQITNSQNLLFLNADLVLCEKACERLYSAVESDSRICAVGPRIYGADGEIELSARSFPTVASGLLGRSSLLTKMFSKINRTPSGISAALGVGGRVDWISGACMLIPRRAFDEVGGFDERYWMYWEDADICRRLTDRGWYAMLCADAHAHHSTGSSGRTERTIRAFHVSAARYYEQHIARNDLTARLARSLLNVRMNLTLHRYAR